MNGIELDASALSGEQLTAIFLIYGVLIAVIVFVVIIFAVIMAEAIRVSKINNERINQTLMNVPDYRMNAVNAMYQNGRKSSGIALLLALGFGSFGFHFLYLGKKVPAVLSMLFFWTGVPAIVAMFNALNMPRTVSAYNLELLRGIIARAVPVVTEIPPVKLRETVTAFEEQDED